MPINYKNYPSNWKSEIRPRILARANNRCEHDGCIAKNGDCGYRDKDGLFYTSEKILELLETEGYDIFCNELSHVAGEAKPIKIVLTIAHLNHDTTDNRDENLKAFCQYHHLRHDIGHHKETRRKNKGLQKLF